MYKRQILNSSSIPKTDLNRIKQNAEEEYPNDYTLQKAYIKGAIKTYNDLKKIGGADGPTSIYIK